MGAGRCVWVLVVPAWLESCKPWAVPALGHFVQPLLLVLMERLSPALQNPVGCFKELLGGCWWPKRLPHLLTPPLKHAAPWCRSELPNAPQKPLLSSSILCYVLFAPHFPPHLRTAGRQLHSWGACLGPLLCSRMSLGNGSTSFPHQFRHRRLVGPDKCHPNCWRRVSDRFTACKVGPDCFYQRCFNNPKSAFQK